VKTTRGREKQRQHRKGCNAVYSVEQGRWATPWWFTGRDEWDGHGKRWLRIECNDPECRAGFWVNERWLAEAVVGLVEEGS